MVQRTVGADDKQVQPVRQPGHRLRLAPQTTLEWDARLLQLLRTLVKIISTFGCPSAAAAGERFGCRRENGHYVVPSEFVIRDCLVRLAPQTLDQALNAWDHAWGVHDDALAMDGKTMKNARDKAGQQSHI